MVRKDRKVRSRRDRIPSASMDETREAIEEERGRLMVAETLLDCVIDAEKSSNPADERHFPSLTEIARDLVNQSIRRLEALPGKNEVKECPPLYWH